LCNATSQITAPSSFVETDVTDAQAYFFIDSAACRCDS